jgi:hypothetical protein
MAELSACSSRQVVASAVGAKRQLKINGNSVMIGVS